MSNSNATPIGDAHHYGLTVSDMDEALTFYRDRLGLEEGDHFHFASEEFDRFVGVDGTDVQIVFLETDGFAVELLEYREPPGEDIAKDIQNHDVGAAHICFAVDNATAVYEDLTPEVTFVSPPQTLENGAIVAYMLDPDGNVVEVLEE